MRKLIVKHFALNYVTKILGRQLTFLRAAFIILPMFIFNGIYLVLTDTYPFDTHIGIVLLLLALSCVFCGFVYFRIKPVKWYELDDSQKIQYLSAHLRGILKTQMSAYEIGVTEKIKKEFENKLSGKKNYQVFKLVFPLVLIILTFFSLLIYL